MLLCRCLRHRPAPKLSLRERPSTPSLLLWVFSLEKVKDTRLGIPVSLPSQYLWACGPRFQPSPGSAEAHRLPDSSSLLLEAGFLWRPSRVLLLVQFVVPEKQGHLEYGELECPGHQLEGRGPLKTRGLRTGDHHLPSTKYSAQSRPLGTGSSQPGSTWPMPKEGWSRTAPAPGSGPLRAMASGLRAARDPRLAHWTTTLSIIAEEALGELGCRPFSCRGLTPLISRGAMPLHTD